MIASAMCPDKQKNFTDSPKKSYSIVYNFTVINDYTIPHGGFDRITPVPYCIYFESKQLEWADNTI